MLKTTMQLKVGVAAELRTIDMAALVSGAANISDALLNDILMVVMDGRYTPNPAQQATFNRRWLIGAYDLIGRIAFVPGTDTPLLVKSGATPQKGQITPADLHLGEIDTLIAWFRYGDAPAVPPAAPDDGGGEGSARPDPDLPE